MTLATILQKMHNYVTLVLSKKAKSTMYPLLISCLSAPDPPFFALLCDPRDEPYKHFSFDLVWKAPESQEEAGASHSGSGILLFAFAPWADLLVLCGDTAVPTLCEPHWNLCGHFLLTSSKQQPLSKLPTIQWVTATPSLAGSELISLFTS